MAVAHAHMAKAGARARGCGLLRRAVPSKLPSKRNGNGPLPAAQRNTAGRCSIGVGLGLKAQAPSPVDGPQPQQQPAGRALVMARGERRFLGSPRGSRGPQAAGATGFVGPRGALALARPAGLEIFALAPWRPPTAIKTPRF